MTSSKTTYNPPKSNYDFLKKTSHKEALRKRKLPTSSRAQRDRFLEEFKRQMKETSTQTAPIRAPLFIKEKIDKEAEKHGANQSDMIRILWEFYELDTLDLFVSRLRDYYHYGLNAEQIAALSVLYSFLSYINNKSGGMLE
jgi:hypothetical protein